MLARRPPHGQIGYGTEACAIGAIGIGLSHRPTAFRLARVCFQLPHPRFMALSRIASAYAPAALGFEADYVMANPPVNISEWWNGRLEGDPLRAAAIGSR